MTDKHIDDAIDRAVRQMMSAEPAPGLRVRVLSQLARREPRPLWLAWVTGPRLVAAGAAIVLLITSLVLLRPRPESVRDTRAVNQASVPSQPIVSTPPPTAPPSATSRRDAAADRRRADPQSQWVRRLDQQVTAATIATDVEVVSGAAQSIPVIGFDPIAPPPIAPSEIAIPPLVLTPLRIDPLPPPGGRH